MMWAYNYKPIPSPQYSTATSTGERKAISNQKLSFYAACAHLIQCIIALVLVFRLNSQESIKSAGVFALNKDVLIWTPGNLQQINTTLTQGADNSFVGNYTLTHTSVHVGHLDVRYAIVCFFALSAFFQGVASFLSPAMWFNTMALQWNYIEYSISASVMMLCIAVEVGITDIYVLVCMFALIFATQMLGLVADLLSTLSENVLTQKDIILSSLDRWCWLVPHVVGWITCLAAYAPVIDAYFTSTSYSTAAKVPDFVTGLIMAEMVLFICFGFVQAYFLFYKTLILQSSSTNICGEMVKLQEQVERIFIFLSLSAKTILAWVIMSPILTTMK